MGLPTSSFILSRYVMAEPKSCDKVKVVMEPLEEYPVSSARQSRNYVSFPCFFKTVSEHEMKTGDSPWMQVPAAFANEYMPGEQFRVIVLECPGGWEWPVGYKAQRFYDIENFASHHQLREGDVLFFKLCGDRRLRVQVFDHESGGEKLSLYEVQAANNENRPKTWLHSASYSDRNDGIAHWRLSEGKRKTEGNSSDGGKCMKTKRSTSAGAGKTPITPIIGSAFAERGQSRRTDHHKVYSALKKQTQSQILAREFIERAKQGTMKLKGIMDLYKSEATRGSTSHQHDQSLTDGTQASSFDESESASGGSSSDREVSREGMRNILRSSKGEASYLAQKGKWELELADLLLQENGVFSSRHGKSQDADHQMSSLARLKNSPRRHYPGTKIRINKKARYTPAGTIEPVMRRRGRPPKHQYPAHLNDTRGSLRDVFVSQRRPVTNAEIEDVVRAAYASKARMKTIHTIVIMRPTFVYRNFILGLSKPFTRRNFPGVDMEVRLCDSSWKAWSCIWNSKYMYVTGRGWRNFALQHCLEEHDACIFEILEQTRNLLTLMVHIFRVVDIPADATGWTSHICPLMCAEGQDTGVQIEPVVPLGNAPACSQHMMEANIKREIENEDSAMTQTSKDTGDQDVWKSKSFLDNSSATLADPTRSQM